MFEISTNNQIYIDGNYTGLAIEQRREGTVIYQTESPFSGRIIREYKMPHNRYAASCDYPASGGPGRVQLEKDIRELLQKIQLTAA